MDKHELCTIARLDRFGSYDYAVPQGWVDADPSRYGRYLWYYPRRKGFLCGRPLAVRAVARLALREMRREEDPHHHRYVEAWAIAHPGRPLDRFGADLLARVMWENGMDPDDRIWAIRWLARELALPLHATIKVVAAATGRLLGRQPQAA